MQQPVQNRTKPAGRPNPLVHVWDSKDGKVRSTFVCSAPLPDDLAFAGSYQFNEGRSLFAQRTAEELAERNVRHALVPNVSQFNASVLDSSRFTKRTLLPFGITTYSNPEAEGEVLELDANANESMLLLTGGCGIGIATADGACVGFHVGVASLVDFGRIKTGTSSREYESVMDAIKAQFIEWQIPLHLVSIRICFSLPPHALSYPRDHEKWAEFNRLFYEDIHRSGYPEPVMKYGSGMFSIPGACDFQGKRIGFGFVGCSHPIPYRGGFAHTRHPNPTLREARNWTTVTVQLI